MVVDAGGQVMRSIVPAGDRSTIRLRARDRIALVRLDRERFVTPMGGGFVVFGSSTCTGPAWIEDFAPQATPLAPFGPR